MLETLITVFHVGVALTLIIVVLFQHGKGASIGASFGGSSQTLFGPRGPATALAKITTGAAVLFMLTSVVLAIFSNNSTQSSVITPVADETAAPIRTELPAGGGPTGPTSQAPAVNGGAATKAPASDSSQDTGGPVERPATSE